MVAAGFGIVGVASRPLLGRWTPWALITAGAVGVVTRADAVRRGQELGLI